MSRLHSRIGTIRQLEILLAVFETGTITGASQSLHLTQPSVSIQLRKLAEAADTSLYNQIGRKIIFTEAGMEMVKAARQVLDTFDQLEMKLSDLQGIRAGRLTLTVVTTAKYFIPHILGKFTKQYPNIKIDLKVGNRQKILERLDRGTDDFYVFGHPVAEQSLNLIKFLPNPLVPIAHTEHPLSKRKSIPFEEFAKEPFIIREKGSGTRFALEEQISQFNSPLNVRFTIESNEAIKHSVMSGLGVSILSRHSLAFGGDAGLSELDVEGLPINTQWYIAHPKRKQLSVVAQAFLSFLQAQTAESLLPPSL